MDRNPHEPELGGAESRRLVDGGATATERLLLQAGIDEAPPNRAGRQRALAALGLAVGASAFASSAKAAKGVALVQAKWVVFGALSAVVAVGTLEVRTKPETAKAPATSSATPIASLGRKGTMTAEDTSPSESAAPPLTRPPSRRLMPRSATPALESTARVPAALPLSPLAEVVTPSELVAQVTALDGARAALRAGSARQCMALLDKFDQSFPRSGLAPEATVVRVSALLALDQRARATDLVRAYCRSGGGGQYGRRLMALVDLRETACDGSSPGP